MQNQFSPSKPLVAAFVQLGSVMRSIGQSDPWPGFEIGLSEAEYDRLNQVPADVAKTNGWFTEENVRHALRAWGVALTDESLNKWLKPYGDLPAPKPKTVAIIMAGNVPMVGFHDLLCVLMAGHRVLVKLSSEDDVLIPIFIKILGTFSPEVQQKVLYARGKMENFDAVIATGSDNSARYFEYYFGKYPSVIRKNRTSVAVITEHTSDEELSLLGEDIFRYFGLGCRNVTKIYVPRSFDLDRFFGAIFPWQTLATHNKYANNYDYCKALWMLNGEELVENGFVLLKHDEGLHSPVGSMFYERYDDLADLNKRLLKMSDQLQCIVGQGAVPFGCAQKPGLADYADSVDTMRFLLQL